jgi:hypothetical protein
MTPAVVERIDLDSEMHSPDPSPRDRSSDPHVSGPRAPRLVGARRRSGASLTMPAGTRTLASSRSCTLPFACWRAIPTLHGLSVNLHPALLVRCPNQPLGKEVWRQARSTRSGTAAAFGSCLVVPSLCLRRWQPTIPATRISRATRFLPTCTPASASSQWIRDDP